MKNFRQIVCKMTVKDFHEIFQDSFSLNFANSFYFEEFNVTFMIFLSLDFSNRFLLSSLSSADLTEMPHALMTFTTSFALLDLCKRIYLHNSF